jgi:SAM-dependent methyltransferase
MNSTLYSYKGALYPEYLKQGNACQHIAATAAHFCKGEGLDVGAGRWPLPGAIPVELKDGGDAMELPHGPFDFVFSSHCLEHLANPIAALEHWIARLKVGGVLFLYLPHPDMEYWRPQHCRKHLHAWTPAQMAQILRDLGLVQVIHSERDLAWSFSAVGFKVV